jgi:hypothetical protein
MNSDEDASFTSGLKEKPDIDSDEEYGDFVIEKFDKEKFLTVFIWGILSAIAGILLISNTKNTPDHVSDFNVSEPIHFISDILPKSPKDMILFVLGNLVLLMGVYYIFQGLKIVVRYIASRTRRY